MQPSGVQSLAEKAAEVSGLLKTLANEQRLLILCHLASADELSVGAIGDRMTLSQSALSQHLAKLREQGLVATRRASQMLYYRICDDRLRSLLTLLRDLYCPEIGTDRILGSRP